MKRTPNSSNRSKSAKNDEHYTQLAANSTTNTFTHNALNQMVGRGVLDAPPTTTFTYTSDGGLSSDGTWTYAYDAEDQLVSVTSSALTNGAIRILNSYDYRHRRTSKTVQRLYSTIPPPPSPPIGVEEWQTLETRTFVYDDWNLIHETIYTVVGGVTNTTEVQYFWGLDLSDSLQGAGGVGGLLAVSNNGQLYFPTLDNNGNATKYVDESGNIVAAYEYDDFGRTISQLGSLADFFRHRFSTKYYDSETGFYYYGHRFYCPNWRIWLNLDTIEENNWNNLYGFLSNNPISETDFLGNMKNSDKKDAKWIIDIRSVEWHVWNCYEFNGRGTKSEYIKHFKNITFRAYGEGVKGYFASQIVNKMGIDSDAKACWSSRLNPLNVYHRTIGNQKQYLVKANVDLVEKHPTCCQSEMIKLPAVGWIIVGPYTQ